MELAGRPVIAWVVRAARAAAGVDEVWVATSTAATDDPIAGWCAKNDVPVHRGSEHDVLDRYAGAAMASAADVVVRLTADCPLLDPVVIAQTIRLRAMTGADYASNVDPPTWPDGLDCEVMTAEALAVAAKEATRPSDREHVTPFIRNNRARFSAESLDCAVAGTCRRALDARYRRRPGVPASGCCAFAGRPRAVASGCACRARSRAAVARHQWARDTQRRLRRRRSPRRASTLDASSSAPSAAGTGRDA